MTGKRHEWLCGSTKKGSRGGPVSLVWLVPMRGTRVALVGNPVGYPMLFGRLRHNLDRAELSAKLAVVEHDATIDEREQGMVLAHAHVAARIEFGPALTHEDVAGNGFLPAELLDAEATTGRITTVTRRTACLLMCPCELLLTLRRPGRHRPRALRRPSSQPSSRRRRSTRSSGSCAAGDGRCGGDSYDGDAS